MDVLGKLSFLDLPNVNSDNVLIGNAGVVSLSADVTANRPVEGIQGRIFLDTSTNRLFYDNGAVWVDTTQVPLISGTTDEVSVVTGTNVTPTVLSISPNPVLPGSGRVRLPAGSTAQRFATPAAGDVRFNTDLGLTEEHDGTSWAPMGRVIQVVTGSVASSTGTTQIPFDNTAPLITEGHQIWTQPFTPLLATSTIVVRYSIITATSTAARTATSSVFFGNTLVGASSTYMATTNVPFSLSVQLTFAPGSTAAVTIQGRCGLNGTGTLSVNQANAVNLAGNAVSEYVIMEIV